jgi:hypothetical protein
MLLLPPRAVAGTPPAGDPQEILLRNPRRAGGRARLRFPVLSKALPEEFIPQSEPDEEEPETSPEETDDAPAPEPAPGKGPRWALGVAALQCQGQSTFWVSSGAALPPAAPLTWSPGLDRVGWLSFDAVFAFVLSPDPPAPPPRPSQP